MRKMAGTDECRVADREAHRSAAIDVREKEGAARWVRLSEGSGGATIDFPAMPHLDHFNSASCVIDRVNDTKLALPNAVAPLGPGKLFTTSWPRFGSPRADAVNDAHAILPLTQRFDLLTSGRLEVPWAT
jgi:hypothetical protein